MNVVGLFGEDPRDAGEAEQGNSINFDSKQGANGAYVVPKSMPMAMNLSREFPASRVDCDVVVLRSAVYMLFEGGLNEKKCSVMVHENNAEENIWLPGESRACLS